MFKNRKRKGFTLIELVIVIAIIGILIAIAIPRFSDATKGAKNTRIEAQARTIASIVTQIYAETQKWPTDKYSNKIVVVASSDERDLLSLAGLKSDAPYTVKRDDKGNVIIKYTKTGSYDQYSGVVAYKSDSDFADTNHTSGANPQDTVYFKF